jgi:hypothetical protein
MTMEAVRDRISEIDVLYSKLDAIELRYSINLLSHEQYVIEKTKLEQQINELFNIAL